MNDIFGYTTFDPKTFGITGLGVRYLTGENLKVVRAEFSTLSWSVLLHSNICALDQGIPKGEVSLYR
jgi:hypothetical protein